MCQQVPAVKMCQHLDAVKMWPFRCLTLVECIVVSNVSSADRKTKLTLWGQSKCMQFKCANKCMQFKCANKCMQFKCANKCMQLKCVNKCMQFKFANKCMQFKCCSLLTFGHSDV